MEPWGGLSAPLSLGGVLPNVQKGPARKNIVRQLLRHILCHTWFLLSVWSQAWVLTCWGSRNLIGVHGRTLCTLLPIIQRQLKLHLFMVHRLRKVRLQKQHPQGTNTSFIRALSILLTFQQSQKQGSFVIWFNRAVCWANTVTEWELIRSYITTCGLNVNHAAKRFKNTQ